MREKSETVLWHLFSASRKELSPQSRALRRLNEIAVVLASEYGTDQMLDTIRMVLALQTIEEQVSLLFAAFSAAFLKRVALNRGYDTLGRHVDMVLAPYPTVVEFAAHISSPSLFVDVVGHRGQADGSDVFSIILFEASAIAAVLVNHLDLTDLTARLSQPYRHIEQPSQEARNVKLKSRQFVLSVDIPVLQSDEAKPAATTSSADIISFASLKQVGARPSSPLPCCCLPFAAASSLAHPWVLRGLSFAVPSHCPVFCSTTAYVNPTPGRPFGNVWRVSREANSESHRKFR